MNQSFTTNGNRDQISLTSDFTFRGDNEVFGSQHNANYLEILELLAESDPFLKSHIGKYENEGKGQSY